MDASSLLRRLDTCIVELEREIHAWHRSSDASQRLAAIPGVGPLTATAVAASVGDARQFKKRSPDGGLLGAVEKPNVATFTCVR